LQKGEATTAAPVFKIDEEFDDYKDVTASNEQVEKNYREVKPPPQVVVFNSFSLRTFRVES
jgi:hypothetical protein